MRGSKESTERERALILLGTVKASLLGETALSLPLHDACRCAIETPPVQDLHTVRLTPHHAFLPIPTRAFNGYLSRSPPYNNPPDPRDHGPATAAQSRRLSSPDPWY